MIAFFETLSYLMVFYAEMEFVNMYVNLNQSWTRKRVSRKVDGFNCLFQKYKLVSLYYFITLLISSLKTISVGYFESREHVH